MILEFGNLVITSDDRNFTLNKKSIVTKSKYPEKIGTEELTPFSYYSNLESALKALGKQVVLENDDAVSIIAKLNELKAEISRLASIFEIQIPDALKEDN